MLRTLLIAILASACVALCAAARGAYLDEGDGTETRPPKHRIPRPPVRRPPPPVQRPVPPPRPLPSVPSNPLTQAVRRLSVAEPYTHKGLTIFPLEAPRVDDSTDYLSLEEALDRDDLAIREKGSGAVPVLLARNTGSRLILMLSGEIVAGGRQNRVLRDDVLLGRHSGWVELPVLCIERGRWHGRDEAFAKSSSLAAVGVRARVQAGVPQSEVWDGVSYYQSTLSAPSATEDLQAVQDSPEVQEAADEYVKAFHKRWPRQTVGMVVARHGRIIAADIFCNAEVFQKHRDRILRSYAVDCYAMSKHAPEEGPHRPAVMPGPRDAERFLERALGAHYDWRGTPGEGELLNVSGAGLSGMGLVYRGALLHASLFAQDEVIILPRPAPGPWREEQRGRND